MYHKVIVGMGGGGDSLISKLELDNTKRIKEMASSELGKKIEKDVFSSCHERKREKIF